MLARRSRRLLDGELGEAARQHVPDFLLERVLALVGGDHDAALGIVAGDGEEGLAQPPVPVEVFLLEAVAGVGERRLGLALQRRGGRRPRGPCRGRWSGRACGR